jgi:hypothetical protein
MVFSPSKQKSLSNLISVMFLLHTNGSGVQWANAAYVGGKGHCNCITLK